MDHNISIKLKHVKQAFATYDTDGNKKLNKDERKDLREALLGNTGPADLKDQVQIGALFTVLEEKDYSVDGLADGIKDGDIDMDELKSLARLSHTNTGADKLALFTPGKKKIEDGDLGILFGKLLKTVNNLLGATTEEAAVKDATPTEEAVEAEKKSAQTAVKKDEETKASEEAEVADTTTTEEAPKTGNRFRAWEETRTKRQGECSMIDTIVGELPNAGDSMEKYKIKSGDTLGEIATAMKEKYELKQSKQEILDALAKANDISDINDIKVGAELDIKKTLDLLKPAAEAEVEAEETTEAEVKTEVEEKADEKAGDATHSKNENESDKVETKAMDPKGAYSTKFLTWLKQSDDCGNRNFNKFAATVSAESPQPHGLTKDGLVKAVDAYNKEKGADNGRIDVQQAKNQFTLLRDEKDHVGPDTHIRLGDIADALSRDKIINESLPSTAAKGSARQGIFTKEFLGFLNTKFNAYSDGEFFGFKDTMTQAELETAIDDFNLSAMAKKAGKVDKEQAKLQYKTLVDEFDDIDFNDVNISLSDVQTAQRKNLERAAD